MVPLIPPELCHLDVLLEVYKHWEMHCDPVIKMYVLVLLFLLYCIKISHVYVLHFLCLFCLQRGPQCSLCNCIVVLGMLFSFTVYCVLESQIRPNLKLNLEEKIVWLNACKRRQIQSQKNVYERFGIIYTLHWSLICYSYRQTQPDLLNCILTFFHEL